ncbi:hypothetical protein GLOIN_2v1524591, partial [Rhizophagus irregularis DAOM 181602=DAOM 197198]
MRHSGNLRWVPQQNQQVKKLAIIGAGAGGSSAAYWISNAFVNSSVKVDTTVYEQSSRIGGRTEIINFERDGITIPIELGASIFV